MHFQLNLLNRRILKIATLYKNCIFQCMSKIFCVEFQRFPLKFHTKYLTHTLIDMYFVEKWRFKSSQIYELVNVFATSPSVYIFPLHPVMSLFTKRYDVLPPNLGKSRSQEIGCYNDRIALKFDRHLGSSAVEMSVKFQSDRKGLNPKLAASRLHEILS